MNNPVQQSFAEMSLDLQAVSSPQNWWVEQLNELAAGGPMSNTVHTTKIFYAAIGAMEKAGDSWQKVSITKREITEAFPAYKSDRNFRATMGQVAEELTDAKVRLRFPRGDTKVIVAIIDCAYINGSLQLTWHPDMRDLLVLMKAKGQFTSYQIKAISHLRTGPQFALFNYLRSMAYLKTVSVSMDLLRDITMCQNSYSLTNDFERHVVLPSVQAINQSGDIVVTATRIGARPILGYEFRVSINREMDQNPSFRALVALLTSYGIQEATSIDLASNLSASKIRHQLSIALARVESTKNSSNPIRNPPAYLASIIRTEAPVNADPRQALKIAKSLELQISQLTYAELSPSEQEQVKRSFLQTLNGAVKNDYIRFGYATDTTSEIRARWQSFLIGALGTESFTSPNLRRASGAENPVGGSQSEFLQGQPQTRRLSIAEERKRRAALAEEVQDDSISEGRA